MTVDQLEKMATVFFIVSVTAGGIGVIVRHYAEKAEREQRRA